MSSARSRGPGPPGVVPAREGGCAAAADHTDAAEHCGSRTRGGADPPNPGHGSPVPPPSWEFLQHPAAEGGELQGLWFIGPMGSVLTLWKSHVNLASFLFENPLLKISELSPRLRFTQGGPRWAGRSKTTRIAS